MPVVLLTLFSICCLDIFRGVFACLLFWGIELLYCPRAQRVEWNVLPQVLRVGQATLSLKIFLTHFPRMEENLR